MFPPLGAVMATMPAVATWYATRWDGAMRPLIGAVLCGANGTSNAVSVSPPYRCTRRFSSNDLILPDQEFCRTRKRPHPWSLLMFSCTPLHPTHSTRMLLSSPHFQPPVCPQTADAAVTILKKLLLPTGQAFLKTATGSFLSDLINNDLGFDTNTAGTFITRDNILGAVELMQLFTSDAVSSSYCSKLGPACGMIAIQYQGYCSGAP